MRPKLALIAAAALLLIAGCATPTAVNDLETRLAATETWIDQFTADCAAEQQAVLARLDNAETGEDRTQDEERSVCGQSISADGASYSYATVGDYQTGSNGSGDDSTGWLEQAAGAAEALHGLLEGVDEEVYQLERAANDELNLDDRQVADAVADGVADVTAATAKAEGLADQVKAALTRLSELAAKVTIPDPTPTTTTTTPATTTTTEAPTTTTTAAAMPNPDPDGPWVIVYSTEPYDYENDRWPGSVEVLQWTEDGPFIFEQRADADQVLSAILDWAAAGSDDESQVNQHFGVVNANELNG